MAREHLACNSHNEHTYVLKYSVLKFCDFFWRFAKLVVAKCPAIYINKDNGESCM